MALVDVELTISSARDLKNVNWKHGDLRAYAAAWINDGCASPPPAAAKTTTKADTQGDTSPSWGQSLTLSVPKEKLRDSYLEVEIRHEDDEHNFSEDNPEKAAKKLLVGRASLALLDTADAGGYDEPLDYTLKLKRPSGRPQGKLELSVRLRERRWATPYGSGAAPYGQRDWQPGYGAPYQAQPYSHPYSAQPYPPTGYPGYGGAPAPYGAPYGSSYPPPPAADQPYGAYAAPPPYAPPPADAYYGQGGAGYQEAPKKSGSKFGGIGTGLAVGALAGAVGGLALGEYIDHKEDEAAEEQADEDAERYAELQAAQDDGGYDDDY